MFCQSSFWSALLLIFTANISVMADQPVPTGAQKSSAVDKTYSLRHRLKPGATFRFEVVHSAKTKTKMNGTEEVSDVLTTSVRAWKVKSATPQAMRFEHVIESVELTQKTGEKAEIRWSSHSGSEPPKAFQLVATQIGIPLATITIDASGKETQREDHAGSKSSLGMGSLALTLPKAPVKIGEQWSVPGEVKTKTSEGLVKAIKIRQLYTLNQVKAGVATITVKSEPLTPIDEESVQAQVVQQLNNGTLRFDIDNGVLLSKELNWDETVVGFQGPDSMMEYHARVTEKLLSETPVRAATKGKRKPGF